MIQFQDKTSVDEKTVITIKQFGDNHIIQAPDLLHPKLFGFSHIIRLIIVDGFEYEYRSIFIMGIALLVIRHLYIQTALRPPLEHTI